MKIKDILKKDIVKDILTNIIYLTLVLIYFITFNTQGSLLDSETLIKYIDISSLTFLAISIVMFEVGYKKDKTKIFYLRNRIFSISNIHIIDKTYA